VDPNKIWAAVGDPRISTGEIVGHTKGRKHTEEAKRKISQANKNLIGHRNSQYNTAWVYNLELQCSKKVHILEVPTYINEGWIRGRKIFTK